MNEPVSGTVLADLYQLPPEQLGVITSPGTVRPQCLAERHHRETSL